MTTQNKNGPPETNNLLSSRLLLKSVGWNLIGNVLPLIVAALTIPKLITLLGTDRFGLLTIAWMLVGYFSLFDFGLGRALTKLVAERLGKGKVNEIEQLTESALAGMLILGIASAILLAALTPWLINSVFHIPEAIRDDAFTSFHILNITIPFVILSTAYIGLLEAHQRFDFINIVRMPMGIANFLGPLVAIHFWPTLSSATAAIALARVVSLTAYRWRCSTLLQRPVRPRIEWAYLAPLLRFGGWLTITNLIGPLMNYSDRFVIGAILTIHPVAFYTTPYEMLSRLFILPTALVGVFFPAMATAAVTSHGTALSSLFERSARLISVAILPIVGVVVAFSPIILRLWINEEFAEKSAFVLRMLAVGLLFGSLARTPFSLLQAIGRADLTAKLNLIQLPFYPLILWLFVKKIGIDGAAIAWTCRLIFDFLLMIIVSAACVPSIRKEAVRLLASSMAAAAYLALLWWAPGILSKIIALLPLFAVSIYLGLHTVRKPTLDAVTT